MVYRKIGTLSEEPRQRVKKADHPGIWWQPDVSRLCSLPGHSVPCTDVTGCILIFFASKTQSCSLLRRNISSSLILAWTSVSFEIVTNSFLPRGIL
jgi:hypothetical protein